MENGMENRIENKKDVIFVFQSSLPFSNTLSKHVARYRLIIWLICV